MSLHVLEDIFCRVHKLHPDADNFLSECSSLSMLIIRGRIDDADLVLPKRQAKNIKIIQINAVRGLIEGLTILEALLAARVGRPASFVNIVRMLRAPYISGFRGAPDSEKQALAHLRDSIETMPVPEHLRPVLRACATQDSNINVDVALGVIRKLLDGTRDIVTW
jgi:hypothetical protein